ncbi:hypothetical protein B0H66DRAFT_28350 [Apodospora peruviana]|uniref:VWFA domain-containing protein n=1 Tax=Apodospora peruviana TaxID=516989 RepID=A0AAE0IR46_9PEZI|nr:hypothetical protein B0H66DRAFT_28350 [Apodospora peruviana]
MRGVLSLLSGAVSLLLASTTAAATTTETVATPAYLAHSHVLRRADAAASGVPSEIPTQVCDDLSINSNNGDRKVAIVIDSSGSMSGSDPDDLRLIAARALNQFLISNAEAGGQKPDQVVVIGFDDTAYTVFGPGDPGDPEADKELSLIVASGGTYIAGGVLQAIDQIGKMSGDTKERSAIVVFTDGSDSSTDTLVDAIKQATSLGIRVSFGFLDLSASYQPEDVLLAVRDSKGVYATITVAAGSRNFVNYVLLNGLTHRDNPQGAGDRLLSGLATTQFIDGSTSVTLKYSASQGERANFTLYSITGDHLGMEAKMNGQTLNTSEPSYYDGYMDVEPPSSGTLEITVTADDNPVKGLFSVMTNSNQPIKNCTVGVTGGNSTGLSTGAKAGLGVGLTALLLGLAGGGFWAYKHFLGGAPSGGELDTAPAAGGSGSGNSTAGPTGAEKFDPHTSVYPVDPSQGMAPAGGGTGGGGPMHTVLPPDVGTNMTGQALGGGGGGGGGPQSGAPVGGSGSAPPPPMSIPPAGPGAPPVTPPATAWAGPPSAFVPPLVPPFKPSSDKPATPNSNHNDAVSPQHTDFQSSLLQQQHSGGGGGDYLSNVDGSQHPLGGYNGYQNALPHGGGGGTPFSPASGSSDFGNHTTISGGSYGNNHTGTTTTTFEAGGSGGNHTHWSVPSPSEPNHTGIGHGSSGGGGNHTNWGTDPTSSSGYGGDAGNNYTGGGGGGVGGGGAGGNPGFTMPGTQMRMGFGAAQDRGAGEEKHHHHPWLAPDSACEHPECPFNLSSHECLPDRERCDCSCRDMGCAYLKRTGGY